jgi:hypothetical protein
VIQYEYRIAVVGRDWLIANRGDDATRELNTLGEDGWQLVAVFAHPVEPVVSVILHRELSATYGGA